MLEYIDKAFGLENIPTSRSTFLLVVFIQTAVYLAIACFAGSWFISKAGNSLSFRISGKHSLLSILLGITVGLSILLIDYFFHIEKVKPTFFSIEPVTIWKGFLAAFYGGITEEILLRYFVVSMIVFIIIKLKKETNERTVRSAFLVAIILGALLFAVGHLPIIAMDTSLSFLIVLRVILVNSIGGLVFGLIYWKWGLPCAMISHFSADLILLVVFPLMNV